MADLDEYSQNELISVGGATLSAISAFLPWITVSLGGMSTSQNGMDVAATLNGTVVLVLAAIVVGIVVARDWEQSDAGAVAALGLITTLIGGMYVMDPASAANASGGLASSLISPGFGLYVTVLGGLGILVGGALGYQD
jgi:hypothetical protein